MERFQVATPKCVLSFLAASILYSTAALGSIYAPHTSTDVANAAMALGFDAASLAAVGVTDDEINAVFDSLDEDYSVFEQMMAQHTAEAAARKAIAEANARLRIDGADAIAQADLDAAETAAALASSMALQLRTQLIENSLAEVAEVPLISPILLDQGVRSRLPAPYRLAVDTIDEAKTLQWALKLETRTQANGGTLPTEASEALGNARGQYEYSAAQIRVQTFEAPNAAAIENWITSN